MACKCMICGVDSKSFDNTRSFHRIPKDDDVKKQWLEVLQTIGCKSVYSSSVVCSDHFAPTDFHITIAANTRRRLLPTAVPKCNLDNEKITNSNRNSIIILNKESVTSDDGDKNEIINVENNDYIEEFKMDINQDPLKIDDNLMNNSNNKRYEISNIQNCNQIEGSKVDIKNKRMKFDDNIVINIMNTKNHNRVFEVKEETNNKMYDINIKSDDCKKELKINIKEESEGLDDTVIAFNRRKREVNVNLSHTNMESVESSNRNLTNLPRINGHGAFIYYHQKMSLDKIIDFMKDSTGVAANYSVHVFPDVIPVNSEMKVKKQLKDLLTALRFQEQVIKHTPISGLYLNDRQNCSIGFDQICEILKASTTGEGVPWSVTVATTKYKEIIKSISFDQKIPICTANFEQDPTAFSSLLERIPYQIKVEQDPLSNLNEDVTFPMYDLSGPYSFSEMHLGGGFCNLMHWGIGEAYKLWLFVPPKYTQDLNEVSQNALQRLRHSSLNLNHPGPVDDWKPSCDSPLLHKKMLLSPNFLENHKIPSEVIIQKPGTLIYVQGTLFYQVVNSGINLTEAILVDNSFCGREISKCDCESKIESIFTSKTFTSVLSKCVECDAYYPDKASLQKHIQISHRSNLPERVCNKKCPMCNTFVSDYSKHKNFCISKRTRCPTCTRFFSTRGMAGHQRSCLNDNILC